MALRARVQTSKYDASVFFETARGGAVPGDGLPLQRNPFASQLAVPMMYGGTPFHTSCSSLARRKQRLKGQVTDFKKAREVEAV